MMSTGWMKDRSVEPEKSYWVYASTCNTRTTPMDTQPGTSPDTDHILSSLPKPQYSGLMRTWSFSIAMKVGNTKKLIQQATSK